MAILRSIPRRRRGPSFRGRIMIDAVRGVLRVRKWPKKRGPPRSAGQRFWVDWFRQANFLAKYADGASMARAIEMTKGSGMYPRDVLLKAMRGRLYVWSTPDGWRWYPVAAIQDISESLDVLAQTVGDVLVRAADRWRSPPAGALGQVLTNQGSGNPPIWALAGGGVAAAELTESPITCDNTVNNYILDVTAYLEVSVIFDSVNLAAASWPAMVFSTDGGVTYKTGASDYFDSRVTATVDVSVLAASAGLSPKSATGVHVMAMLLSSLRAIRSTWQLMSGVLTADAAARGGASMFDGPITHIKLFTLSGTNYSSGTIRAVGLKSI